MEWNLKQLLLFLLVFFYFPLYSQVNPPPQSLQSLNEELFDAVLHGYYNKAADLIEKGANVNAYSEDGVTPLLYATERNDYRMVQLLLESKADPNAQAKTNKGEFPLLIACQRGYARLVNTLLNYNANVNLASFYGIAPLHYSSFYNDSAVIQTLLNSHANVNTTSTAGETPLFYAAFNGSLFATAKLLQNGADPDKRDNEGFSPLMVASQNGHNNIVIELMKGGADLNIQNKQGFSGLSYAIINDQNEIADLLLLNGANFNEQNTLSLNPRALARIVKNKPVLDSLRKAGAKRNFLPTFNYQGSIGFDFRFNNRDFLTGLSLSNIDVKYGLEFSVFYFLRPFAVPILVGGENNTYYQYWERRHIIGASLGKRFTLFEKGNKAFLFSAEGLYEYHFGRYRGTIINNKGGLLLSPRMSFIWIRKGWDLRLAGQYTNYSITGMPDWYIGCSVHWAFRLKFNNEKEIYLIDYK